MQISEQSGAGTESLAIVFPFMKNETDDWISWRKRLECISGDAPEEINGLKPFIRFVVEAIHPSRIYLLNNRGAGNTEKCYNLLVVTKGTGIPHSDLQPVLEMAYLKGQRIQCMLYDHGTVMEGLKNGHVFYCLHCRPENLIYEDNTTAFPVTAPEDLGHLKKQVFKRFEASMIIAKDFYLNALFFNGSHSSPLIAFFLHQAVELTYRSVLVALSGSCKKTHELLLLRKQADRFAPQLNRFLRAGTTEETRLIGLLDKAYTAARYDADFRVTPEDIAGLTEDVAMLLDAAETLVAAGLNCQL